MSALKKRLQLLKQRRQARAEARTSGGAAADKKGSEAGNFEESQASSQKSFLGGFHLKTVKPSLNRSRNETKVNRGPVSKFYYWMQTTMAEVYMTSTKDEPDSLPRQKEVKRIYDGFHVQTAIAISIALNFIISAIEKQVIPLPDDSDDEASKDLFLSFEIIFNTVFLVDLLVNMYANWFLYFFFGPLGYWNQFDFFIVVCSWVTLLANSDSMDGLSVLRLFRAFRVFRLFKTLESLRLIIEGVLASIPGVTNAFAILFIFMGIWSIIAVEYFSPFKQPGLIPTAEVLQQEIDENICGSGGNCCDQFFGNFLKSMFSMFQILTGDSWNAQITSYLVYNKDRWYAGFISVLFVFIAMIVLSNVVVAILLDKFLNAVAEQEERKEAEREKAEKLAAERAAASHDDMDDMNGGMGMKLKTGLVSSSKKIFWASPIGFLVSKIPSDLKYQEEMYAFYHADRTQIGIGVLIMLNFIVSAIASTILPDEGTALFDMFAGIDDFFIAAFTIELIINYWGSWPTEFWFGPTGGWNAFDFLIVTISLISRAYPDLPGVAVFRLFRAFRVIRLFKRVESLKLIVEAVLLCMPKVCQTFAILVIIMGVWSILGVEFFAKDSPQAFGSFSRSFLTMWQVLTCDSWASGDQMARYLIFDETHAYTGLPRKGKPLAAFFFITYIFVGTIIMSNVVITVLLEGYLSCCDKLKEEKEKAAAERIAEENGHSAGDEELMELKGSNPDPDPKADGVDAETANEGSNPEGAGSLYPTEHDLDLQIISLAMEDNQVRRKIKTPEITGILSAILKREGVKQRMKELLDEHKTADVDCLLEGLLQ